MDRAIALPKRPRVRTSRRSWSDRPMDFPQSWDGPFLSECRRAPDALFTCYTALMVENPDNAEPRRRWYQFSLRTLLIGVALLAIICRLAVWQIQLAAEHRALIDRMTAEGRFTTNPSHGEERMVFYSNDKEFTPEEVREIRTLFPDALIAEFFGGVVRPFNPYERMQGRKGLLNP